MSDSDTPETDAVFEPLLTDEITEGEIELCNLARRLERERDEADRRAGAAERNMEELKDSKFRRERWLDKAKNDWGVNHRVSFDMVWEEALAARRERDELRARVAELEGALTRLRDCDWTITLPDRMDAVRDIAREALAKKETDKA